MSHSRNKSSNHEIKCQRWPSKCRDQASKFRHYFKNVIFRRWNFEINRSGFPKSRELHGINFQLKYNDYSVIVWIVTRRNITETTGPSHQPFPTQGRIGLPVYSDTAAHRFRGATGWAAKLICRLQSASVGNYASSSEAKPLHPDALYRPTQRPATLHGHAHLTINHSCIHKLYTHPQCFQYLVSCEELYRRFVEW